MISSQGISKHPPEKPSLNYRRLREEGIQILQKICGEVWTDYNVHDPGVTILEILCYALTDLGYQTETLFDALRSGQTLDREFIESSFFSKPQLLEAEPLTRIDYERFIEDVFPQVHAAWVESLPLRYGDEVIHGGYDVALFLQPDQTLEDPNSDIIQLALQKNRSLLEIILFDMENQRLKWDYIRAIENCTIDAATFIPFETHHCQIELELELLYANRRVAQKRRLKARISVDAIGFKSRAGLTVTKNKRNILKKLESDEFLEALRSRLEIEKEKCLLLKQVQQGLLSHRNLCENFTSFRVVNLQEIQITSEVILGRTITNAEALIDYVYDRLDDFLIEIVHSSKSSNQRGQKNILYGSNLIEEIIGIQGVEAAQLLSLNLLVDGVPTVSASEEGSLDCIQLKRFSDYVPKINRRKSRIILMRQGVEESVNFNRIRLSYDPKMPVESVTSQTLSTQYSKPSPDQPVAEQVGQYYSIQNDFPKNYRLDSGNTSKNVPLSLLQKINHLKGYLFYFERLLVDYSTRLSGVGHILSVYQDLKSHGSEIQRLAASIPDFDSIELDEKKLTESGQESSTSMEAKHRLVDHLLARFATVYKAVDSTSDRDELEAKIALLRDIPTITSQRGLGVSLSPKQPAVWGGDLLSGFEKRVYRLMGIGSDPLVLRKLTEIKGRQPSGFYCVEHILLAQRWDEGLFPRKFNRAAELLHDYLLGLTGQTDKTNTLTFQLSIILPDWYTSWNKRRHLVENAIKEEVPAHILPYFHWLDKSSMVELEILLADWLEAMLHLYNQ